MSLNEVEKPKFNPKVYKKKYDDNNYKKITIKWRLDDEDYPALLKIQKDQSLSAFIKEAVKEKLKNKKIENNS